MRKVTLLAALLLAPAVSQAATLEDLLVEKGVITKGEAAAATGSAGSKVYYNKGTRIDFPDSGFTMGVNTFLQTRYTFTDNDDASDEGNTSSFDVKRARIIVSGTALNEEFSYKVEGDFVSQENDGRSSAGLKDGYIMWHACDWADVKMGQFKINYGRQFVNSDAKLQFADRSATSDYFTLSRQNGLAGTARFADDTLWVTGGIYNGESDGERGENTEGVDTRHTGAVSVRWNPMGSMDAYEEGDVDWTEDMALSFGAAYARVSANTADFGGGFGETVNANLISVDANMKYMGWSLHAELFNNASEGDDSNIEREPTGFYIQGGYFIDPKTIELAARYGYTDCDDGQAAGECAGLDNANEVTAGINYYWWKHQLKAQLNYSFVNEDIAGPGGDDLNTNRWIFQLSSFF